MSAELALDEPEVKALKSVAAGDFVRSESSDAVVDAVARMEMRMQQLRIQTLQRAAKTLLTLRLPTLDLENPIGLENTLERIERVQSALVGLDKSVRNAAPEKITSNTQKYQEFERIVLVSTEKLYGYMERLRWAAMNAQAELELQSGKGKSFGNVDAAITFLKRLG